MLARIHIRQVCLGPEVPLGRRGCIIEESRTIEDRSAWEDTYFFEAIKIGQGGLLNKIIQEHGEELFSILKTIEHSEHPQKILELPIELHEAAYKLRDLKVISERENGFLSLLKPKGGLGSEFECVVQMALEKLFIQAKRDVKIKYPYPNQPYDPDGQKYDVLAGLDLTKLLWIECKKPLYLKNSQKPLGNILTVETIRKFYRRCHFLRPSIAVFLVDTLEDYRDFLYGAFSPEFLSSGCFIETVSSSNQILARVHGFVYFARIDYKTPREYFPAISQSICQILHDARRNWPEIGFNGNPFRN